MLCIAQENTQQGFLLKQTNFATIVKSAAVFLFPDQHNNYRGKSRRSYVTMWPPGYGEGGGRWKGGRWEHGWKEGGGCSGGERSKQGGVRRKGWTDRELEDHDKISQTSLLRRRIVRLVRRLTRT